MTAETKEQDMNNKQKKLIKVVEELQENGNVYVSYVAIIMDTTPQAIGRLAAKIPGMGTHPSYHDKKETCIYYTL